jgi:hypothetical protein
MSPRSAHALEARARLGAPSETLASLYLACERKHDRTAILESSRDGRSEVTPDWRFFRHVVRTGLYLRERLGLRAGERIALVGPPSVAWLVADWAALAQGVVSVVVDSHVPDGRWRIVAPRVAFVADPRAAERLAGVLSDSDPIATIVTLDPRASTGAPRPPAVLSFAEILDLGGTLDTAERAGAFRAQARQVGPDTPALAHAGRGADASAPLRILTHGEVVARIRRGWWVTPPRPGRVAYVTEHALSLAEHVALFGGLADGCTRTVLGAPAGRRPEARRDEQEEFEQEGEEEADHEAIGRPDEPDGAKSASTVQRWFAVVSRRLRDGRQR